MHNSILVVHTNPASGAEDEYNRWYDEQHLPDVLQVPGFVSARRYKLSETQMKPLEEFRYLAIYEIEGDPEAAIRALRAAIDDGMYISEAMVSHVRSTVYEPIWAEAGDGEQ